MTSFALPEFGDGAVFPGAMAIGFHFVDYVVHGWDVAASLGVPYELPAAVVDAVLPLVLAVPDGDIRTTAGSPFAPALESGDRDDFERILRHLGRNPAWADALSFAGTLSRTRRNGRVADHRSAYASARSTRAEITRRRTAGSPADSRCASRRRCRTPSPAVYDLGGAHAP